MKFKEGDTVKVIVDANTLERRWIGRSWAEKLIGATGEVITVGGEVITRLQVRFSPDCGGAWWLREEDLELVEEDAPKASTKILEEFLGGATRTQTEGRLSYVRALSPVVLRRYVQYLAAHRKQADGSMREFDNWKNGIPIKRYLDGLGRHFVALWLLLDGFEIHDDPGQEGIEDVLCAILFNSMGMLHELITDLKGEKVDRTKPVPGGY